MTRRSRASSTRSPGEFQGLADVDSVRQLPQRRRRAWSRQTAHTALVTVRLKGDKEHAVDSAAPAGRRRGEGRRHRRLSGDHGRLWQRGRSRSTRRCKDTLAERREQSASSSPCVILLLVIGAAFAAGLPILVGILAIFVAVGATALASNTMEMSNFVVFIITMIGLAVGIDYSLFIIQRFREERATGLPSRRRDRRRGLTPPAGQSPSPGWRWRSLSPGCSSCRTRSSAASPSAR